LGKLGKDIAARILRIGNVAAGCGAIDDLRWVSKELIVWTDVAIPESACSRT
jgi:hypothetical protein